MPCAPPALLPAARRGLQTREVPRGSAGHRTAGDVPRRERGTGGTGEAPGLQGGQEQREASASLARPVRPRLSAAGTRGRCRGARGARTAGHAAPGSAPRPLARAPAGGFTHHQPWLRGRLAATILFPSRSAGAARLLPATSRAPRRPRRPPPPGGPARSPGSPRSPALDNALVKTAELFLTSPPPLLIKAPP